jgi:hypothetical protein
MESFVPIWDCFVALIFRVLSCDAVAMMFPEPGIKQAKMNQTAPSFSAKILLRSIILAIAGIGVYCCTNGVGAFPHEGWTRLIFGVIFEGGFGALCLFAAWKAWFDPSARSVRRLCFVGSLILFFCSIGAADAICVKITGLHLAVDVDEPFSIKTEIVRTTITLLLPIVAMIFYRWAMRWLFRQLDLEDDRTAAQRLWSIKLSLGLIAFNVLAASGAIDYSKSRTPQNPIQGPDFWGATSSLATLVLAVAIYEIGMRIARRRLGISTARGHDTKVIYEIPPKWPVEIK